MTTGLIGTSLSRPGSIQPAATVPKPSLQPYGDFIPIDRTDEYWVSVWSFMRARSAGTGRLWVREYDVNKALLATTVIAEITAAQTRWTRHSLHCGPIATLTRSAWNAATVWIKIIAFADGSPNMTWELDAWQAERGPHPTSYAPRPQELVNGQIDRAEIAPLAIQAPMLDDLAVTAAKVAALAITETKIADDAISTPKLQALAITAAKIDAGAVTAAKIQAGAVEADKIAANAVIAGKVAAGAIATNNLQAGAINADKIAAGAVEATKIAANAIVTGKIASGVSATGMLIVSAADGTTVIIDGTSQIFKIVATGTLGSSSFTNPANPGSSVTTTIATGLTYQPAHIIFVDAASSTHHGTPRVTFNNAGAALDWYVGWVQLVNTNATKVVCEVASSRGTGTTGARTFRYFLLKEIAF